MSDSNKTPICPFGEVSCETSDDCTHRLCDPHNPNCTSVNTKPVSNFQCGTSKSCPSIGYSKEKCNIAHSSAGGETSWCCNS